MNLAKDKDWQLEVGTIYTEVEYKKNKSISVSYTDQW